MTSSSLSAVRHRRLQGVVVSTAMQRTAVVRVDRRVADKKYGKYYTVSKNFLMDNPEQRARVGDEVTFEECRPLSKQKRWRYVGTVKRADGRALAAEEGAMQAPAESA